MLTRITLFKIALCIMAAVAITGCLKQPSVVLPGTDTASGKGRYDKYLLSKWTIDTSPVRLYLYDSANRYIREQTYIAGAFIGTDTLVYDNAGRPSKMMTSADLPNGYADRVIYTFDGQGRLKTA